MVVDPITAGGISTAGHGKKVFLMIVPEKADFRMSVPGKAVSQRIGRAKADSHRTAQEKEAWARKGLLTGSREQDPADSVTATNLFFGTGKVPGSNNAKGFETSHDFQQRSGFFGNFFPQLH
jgi:hypothetical protein